MNFYFQHLKRQSMIQPYVVSTNSKGREFINRKLMIHFSSFFKDGDKILFLGRHPRWDYSVFFNGPHKQCEYVVSDIEPDADPDIVDNIADSKFGDESFHGIILIGIFDSMKGEGTTPNKIKNEIRRILKSDGRLFAAINGKPRGSYNPIEDWPNFYVDEVYWIWGKTHLMEEGKPWYGKGDNQAIFLIMRKR